jgi:adenylosuccinate synthase
MIDVIVGAQFGSEAKGAVACALAQMKRYDYLVRVAGPNAGHTGYDSEGRKWALRQVPVAAIWDHAAAIYLGPGSEIDIEVLREEVVALDEAGHSVSGRLVISPQASILTPEHKYREGALQMHETMGSTGKGVGACRAERIMRQCPTAGQMAIQQVLPGSVGFIDLNGDGKEVMLEGTQGYGLGLHAGYYPHCTSSDCRAIDFMAMADVGLDNAINTYVVARTFPIRVAGPSGHLENETTWEHLNAESGGHIKPERTTVTKKIRRVAYFDPALVHRALAANGTSTGTCNLCLTFWDYIDPSTYEVQMPLVYKPNGPDLLVAEAATRWLEKYDLPVPSIVTTGPRTWVMP